MLINSRQALEKAVQNKYALGAFNIVNMETLKAVVEAAKTQTRPVIVQITNSALNWAGLEYLLKMAVNVLEKENHSFILHLDHASKKEMIQNLASQGFNSFMYDGSKEKIEMNIKNSQIVKEFLKPLDVALELEVGKILGKEGDIAHQVEVTLSTEEIIAFYQKTKPEALAFPFGNVHGIHKIKSELNFTTIKELRKALPCALVMHGTSGTSDEEIQLAIQSGMNKINVATDLMRVMTNATKEFYAQNPSVIDIRKINSYAIQETVKMVAHYLKIINNA